MSTIIEIRPEHGGKDAQDFAVELKDSVTKALLSGGYDVTLEPTSTAERGFIVSTMAPMRTVRWLEGLHTVQRIPKGSAARHTSGATIVVRKQEDKPVEAMNINEGDIRIDRYRGRGSGGQRKNKVSTAIRLVHIPTGIVITRETGRKQSDNLESAMEELRQRLLGLQVASESAKITSQRDILEQQTKMFTHNYQRGEVVCHATGKRWAMKKWNSGRIELGK